MEMGLTESGFMETAFVHTAVTPPGTTPYGGRRRRLVAVAIALAAASSLALTCDLDVARWCQAGHIPGEVRRFLNFTEVFAHGMGVGVILLAALALDPSLTANRSADGRPGTLGGMRPSGIFLRMVAAACAGGIMVDIIKAVVDRVRPRAADLSALGSSLATFGTTAATGVTSHSDVNSFPSGHAAMAAGLAATLSWRYPRATWLFVALATAAATQRVATSAHYPSDVLMGAALGLVGAAVFLEASCRPPHAA